AESRAARPPPRPPAPAGPHRRLRGRGAAASRNSGRRLAHLLLHAADLHQVVGEGEDLRAGGRPGSRQADRNQPARGLRGPLPRGHHRRHAEVALYGVGYRGLERIDDRSRDPRLGGGLHRAAARPRANRRASDYPDPVPLPVRAGRADRQGGLAQAMSQPVYIDINCDMGESYGRWTLGHDEEGIPNITSANIACGFHGGDPHVMRRTVELAIQHGVAVGAHPGLPDLMGFGRRRMDVSPGELKDIHRYQVGALAAFAQAAGTRIQHVKPHGIQYHMFEENLPLGRASAEQVFELDPEIILMTMAMTKYDAEARKVKGVRIAAEGFADRVYADDGQLVTRKLGKDALITDPAKAADQAIQMAMEGKVRTITGKLIDAKVETICIHGDSPGSDKIAAAVRGGLVKAGAVVKPLRDWLPRSPQFPRGEPGGVLN